jgi:hypothetical protein
MMHGKINPRFTLLVDAEQSVNQLAHQDRQQSPSDGFFLSFVQFTTCFVQGLDNL